ncbi:hypothetical protein [Agromyces bauzanensis]
MNIGQVFMWVGIAIVVGFLSREYGAAAREGDFHGHQRTAGAQRAEQ